jgi:L-lactate dehydrogenase (cytochrome)
MSTTVMGQKLDMPLYFAPTALQRLFHHEGEIAVGKAAEKFGTMCGISSLGTASSEELSELISTPKLFQLYVHKDQGLNKDLVDRCKASNFEAMAVTVDTAVGGNRERDLYSGFTIPMKLTLSSLIRFGLHPRWAFNYLTHSKWELSNLKNHISEGTNVMTNISDYFTKMTDQSLDWKAVEEINKNWGKEFAIKGIMSVEDAKKAVDIGATAIMVSNHGGRQLDGARSPFDQLAEIVDAVGDKIDVICEGGIRRGTHVLKALSLGAKACSGGRMYLYALAAGGQKGVERIMGNLRNEIERDMKLMGVKNIDQLTRNNLKFR